MLHVGGIQRVFLALQPAAGQVRDGDVPYRVIPYQRTPTWQQRGWCRAHVDKDEPTEGLAPKLVEQVGTLLDEIAKRGTAILLVEQKLTIALKISRRLYVMGHGRIVFEGTPAELAANVGVRKEWLEV